MLAYHHMRQDARAAATFCNQHSLLPGPSTCQVDCPKVCISNMLSCGDVAKAYRHSTRKRCRNHGSFEEDNSYVFILLYGLKRRSFSFGSLDVIDSIDTRTCVSHFKAKYDKTENCVSVMIGQSPFLRDGELFSCHYTSTGFLSFALQKLLLVVILGLIYT